MGKAIKEGKPFLLEIFKPEKFTPSELDTVLGQFSPSIFQKNEYLVEEGQVTHFYYFLESGFARSYAIDVEGKDVTTNFYSEKDIVIDWHSFFLKTTCRESIQALSPCRCWKITFEGFMTLFGIEAFREVGRTRLVSSYFQLKNHTVSMIADDAKERYLQLLREKPAIIQNVPLKHIATFLGITDTSLSRIRKEIVEAKIE